MMRVFLFAMVGGLLLIGQSASAASGDLNVQIETPKVQVSDPNFKIGFVALDILGRSITVDCEKKGPSDGGFSTFESLPLIAGGTSGNCTVDASVMPADGAYLFRVTATAGSDDETTDPAVSVELISGTPSTPLNYSRASCTVTFTTANDGLTDTVELYRSLSSTFSADASTLVATSASIGPNVAGTLTDPNGNCGGRYFYAIRAVAQSGNGSGFVGDKNVVIDNENKIKHKTVIKKVAGPTTVLGAIPVTGGGPSQGGAVEGAATTGDGEVTPPEPGTAEQEGSVLGDATAAAEEAGSTIQSHPLWSALILLILSLLGYYGYQSYHRNRKPRV